MGNHTATRARGRSSGGGTGRSSGSNAKARAARAEAKAGGTRTGKTSADEETKALRSEAKALKAAHGVPREDIATLHNNWLRHQDDPTDPAEALARSHGDYQALFRQLAHEPTGVTEAMAHHRNMPVDAAKLPRGADRLEIARHIATQMAPAAERAGLEKSLLREEIRMRAAAKAEREATKGARSTQSGTRAAKSEEAAAKATTGAKSAREANLEAQLAAVRAENAALRAGSARAGGKAAKTGEAGAKASGRGKGGKTAEETLRPITTAKDEPGLARRFDPYHAPDARYLRVLYGDHQLAQALEPYQHDLLRETARRLGMPTGRSKAATISNIVSHITHEPYQETVAKLRRATERMNRDIGPGGTYDAQKDYYAE